MTDDPIQALVSRVLDRVRDQLQQELTGLVDALHTHIAEARDLALAEAHSGERVADLARELCHEAVVDEGRRHGDLRTRLGAQITRARQLYDERVPPRVRSQSDFFEAELISTLADGNAALLGLAR